MSLRFFCFCFKLIIVRVKIKKNFLHLTSSVTVSVISLYRGRKHLWLELGAAGRISDRRLCVLSVRSVQQRFISLKTQELLRLKLNSISSKCPMNHCEALIDQECTETLLAGVGCDWTAMYNSCRTRQKRAGRCRQNL